MSEKPNASLLSSPYVRASILGGVVIGVAVAAREVAKYEDAKPERERAALFEHVAAMHEHAGEAVAKDPALDLTHAGWFPQKFECGVREHVVADYPSPWDDIGLVPTEGEHIVRVQMKVVHPAKASKQVTWYARRDTDCDGLFETYRLDAVLGERANPDDVQVQHIGE